MKNDKDGKNNSFQKKTAFFQRNELSSFIFNLPFISRKIKSQLNTIRFKKKQPSFNETNYPNLFLIIFILCHSFQEN